MPHADPVKQKEYAKAYNQRDYVKVKKKEYTTEYVKRNYEIVKKKHCEHSKKYRKENPEKVNENKSKRRALEIRTSKFEINNYGNTLKLFKLSNKKTKETGRDYHVDHIVPLQGRLVSGFHVSGNLRVVLADTNLSKNNQYTARGEALIERRMIRDWIANGVKFKLSKPKKKRKVA
tara:strand:- start:17 stop:544 length:528 start_codon:yes stop_codon:yes gene_type:complete